MKEIRLTNSRLVALVDDEDYERVTTFSSWFLKQGRYAYSTKLIGRVSLHHYICGEPPRGLEWDHRNENKLDCRKENLRPATHAQNNQNVFRPGSSGMKGVYLDKSTGKWRAAIRSNGVRIMLGRFSDITLAARAYDEAAKKYHGEFARINGV